MGLLGHHAVNESARFHQQTRRGAERAVCERQPGKRELGPGHRIVVGIQLWQDFAEKQDQECEDYRLEHEAQHRTHTREYGSEGEVAQHYYGDVHQIVGDQYCRQQALRVRKKFAYSGSLGCFVELVALRFGEGKIGNLAPAHETREKQAQYGYDKSHDLARSERRSGHGDVEKHVETG